MPTASTLLSVVVLAATLLAVVAFAIAAQNVRYVYLQQLEYRVARTLESVSAGVWYSGGVVVVEVRNTGGRGVYVEKVKVVVGYTLDFEDGRSVTGTRTSVFGGFHLPPLQRRLFTLRIGVVGAETRVTYVAVAVATDRNVYIFDPAPPMDSVVVVIDRGDVGKTFTVSFPGGGEAKFTVYEYLLCGIGNPSRHADAVAELEAVRVLVARGEEGGPEAGFYNYGYDPESSGPPPVSISVDSGGDVTVCRVDFAGVEPGGRVVAVSRGLVLVGTDTSGYDVVAFSFAEGSSPELAGVVGDGVYAGAARANTFVFKVPLPAGDVTVFDFLGPQVAPWPAPPDTAVINIGNYYSQAVLVGQVLTVRVWGGCGELELHVRFGDPYPVLLVLSPPQLEV